MANPADIELSIGINTNNFEDELTRLAQHTQDVLSSAGNYTNTGIQNMLGSSFIYAPATKSWQQWSNVVAHVIGNDDLKTVGGTYNMTGNLMRGVYNDLRASGYRTGGAANKAIYSDAMAAAAIRIAMPDDIERKAMLSAYGLGGASVMADNAKSGPGKIIEDNYWLMQQEWAQDMVYSRSTKLRKDGTRLRTRGDADFQQMREYAVDIGIAKWTDKDKHDAEHFELIEDSIDSINKKSDKTKQLFNDWHDSLKGVLGSLAAISGIAIGSAIKFAKEAENGVVQGATTLDKRRSIIGMSDIDVLGTQLAGNALGIGSNAIYNEVMKLAEDRSAFKILGSGTNPLFASLSGIFGTIMDENNSPFEAYKRALEALYTDYQNAPSAAKKEEMLSLLNKQGLGSIAQIIGAFDNPNIAGRYSGILDIFNLTANPYYGAYSKAEGLNIDIAKLNKSIETSALEMYNTWEETFGLKFKGWWDVTLKDTIVPWFGKIIKAADTRFSRHSADTSEYWSTMYGDMYTSQFLDDKFHNGVKDKTKPWGTWKDRYATESLMSESDFSMLSKGAKVVRGMYEWQGVTGSTFLGMLNLLSDKANYTDYATDTRAQQMYARASWVTEFLNNTGLIGILSDSAETDSDKFVESAVRHYLKSGDTQTIINFAGKLMEKLGNYSDIQNLQGAKGAFGGTININLTQDASGNWHYSTDAEMMQRVNMVNKS